MAVLIAIFLAVQGLAVTAATGTSGGSVAHDELRGTAAGVLAVGAERGSLSETVRYWNNSTVERTFAHADRPEIGYGEEVPPTAFGALLGEVLDRQGYRFNVFVTFPTTATLTRTETLTLVYHGVPGDDAIVETHPVTLFDGARLTGPRTANETIGTANRSGAYPIPDVAPDSSLYSVVEVRLVVWR